VTVALFTATHPLAFLDYFRIPYQVVPDAGSAGRDGPLRRFCGQLWTASGETGRTFSWLRADAAGLPKEVTGARRVILNGGPVFGRVVPDAVAGRWLAESGDDWRPVEPVADGQGRQIASVWQDADGSVFLPFDPGEAMRRLWTEQYDADGATIAGRLRSAAVSGYYALRPALPRPAQIALRRAFTRVQRQADFPRWPIETALHDLYDWLFGRLAGFAGRPVPWLDLWPDGRSWALVLTHDVETSAGCRNLHRLRDVERQLGYVSSWNFVPLRYDVADDVLDGLRGEGCEIGVHGLLHDGRDLGSKRLLRRRLPRMREYARRWEAVGFRAPATQRRWDWMPLLGFEYDSSYHDSAPYEPTPGGCCSYLPYLNQDMVELPITLPQDHTIFEILQQPDERVWLDKADHLRSRRGMVLVLTHPDYTDDPRLVLGYRRLLERFADDADAWRALPGEVNAWWRRRAQSSIDGEPSGWTVRGPAAPDGSVRLAHPATPTLTVRSSATSDRP
jgi:hypothetical protein